MEQDAAAAYVLLFNNRSIGEIWRGRRPLQTALMAGCGSGFAAAAPPLKDSKPVQRSVEVCLGETSIAYG